MNGYPNLGPYEILQPLGAGGMGEVYRARDPRLNRDVALKILPSDVASDRIRRHRFLEEARAAASLNHPNILAVFDVSLAAGTPFIVSELLDGAELRDEIDRGPVPTKRLIDLAVQMAAGLSAAHAAGIVHRDLKPENVIVTREGRVKIVDFGLAKDCAALCGEASRPGQTVTLPGAVLGTPLYMSPEQASGDPVDYRSDQFSLGLILYEMATGVQPFRRPTPVQTMSAIVSDEAAPIARLNDRTPLVLQWIIERCLAKDPDDRYASTVDLSKDLATLQRRLTEVSGQSMGKAGAPRSDRLRAGVVVGFGLLALAAAVMPSRLTAPLPVKYTPLVTDAQFQSAPAWSPDGSTMAYVAPVEGILQVFTTSVTSPALHQQITQERFDARDPFWSPDGTRLYYHRQARESPSLWSVSAAGGPPELVAENAARATISPDGSTLVFFRGQFEQSTAGELGSIWVSSPGGADGRRYAEGSFDTRVLVDGTLRFSPDGSRLLAWVWGWEDTSLVTLSAPEFWVLPFPEGRPRRVLQNLSRAAPVVASFDWLPDGRRIVVALWDTTMNGTHLWIADVESGATTPLTPTHGSENRPAVAPGGGMVAFTREDIDFDLIEIPLDASRVRSLLATSRNELDPAFSADGSQYAYVSDKGGLLQIWMRGWGTSYDRLIVSAQQFRDDATLALGAPAISRDGQRIAYQRYGERSGYQIWVSTVAAAGPPVPLAAASLYQDAPTWSPDGDWIAFIERTTENVYALSRARVGTNEPSQIVLADRVVVLSRPKWSPDGRWILCDTTDGLALVRPEGGEVRVVSEDVWIAYTWSADSRHMYGLREGVRPRHFELASVDIETLEEHVINPDVGVIPPAFQPIRGLELTGRGTLATSVASARSDIWLVAGMHLGRQTLLDRLTQRR